MACCGLQCGVGEQAEFLPPYICHCLGDERRDTSCVTTSRFLDVATKETMTRTGEPMAPLSFRGFRLHIVWNRPPGGDSVHQVAFPHLLGKATTPMLEKFPQSLLQGPKMAINLGPPSSNHWNIDLGLVLPLAIDTYKQRHEAKQAEQDPEGESAGAEGSPKEVPVPGKAPQVVASGSKATFPTEITHQGVRALETVSAFSNTFTPSVSRYYMTWEA